MLPLGRHHRCTTVVVDSASAPASTGSGPWSFPGLALFGTASRSTSGGSTSPHAILAGTVACFSASPSGGCVGSALASVAAFSCMAAVVSLVPMVSVKHLATRPAEGVSGRLLEWLWGERKCTGAYREAYSPIYLLVDHGSGAKRLGASLRRRGKWKSREVRPEAVEKNKKNLLMSQRQPSAAGGPCGGGFRAACPANKALYFLGLNPKGFGKRGRIRRMIPRRLTPGPPLPHNHSYVMACASRSWPGWDHTDSNTLFSGPVIVKGQLGG